MLDRRLFLGLSGSGLLARAAVAQPAYPNRAIRMIIPVGVGGATDVVGRILAEAMATRLGQPVVAENIAGAGSTVGAAAFQRTPADGYTVFIGTNNHPVMRQIYPDFPFDPMRDFVPVALAARQPSVLAVHPSVPAQDVAGLLTWLRQQGEAANYGATNPGATNHLAGELFKQLAGLRFTIVPYRTAANAVTDLVAGRMQLTIDSPVMLAPLMRDGSVRGLAVSSDTPSALVPGVPTLQQAGVPGYEMTAWQALYVKPGTPPAIVARLEEVIRDALRDAAVQARLARVSSEVWPDTSPAAAAAHLQAEITRWAPIVAGIRQGG